MEQICVYRVVYEYNEVLIEVTEVPFIGWAKRIKWREQLRHWNRRYSIEAITVNSTKYEDVETNDGKSNVHD